MGWEEESVRGNWKRVEEKEEKDDDDDKEEDEEEEEGKTSQKEMQVEDKEKDVLCLHWLVLQYSKFIVIRHHIHVHCAWWAFKLCCIQFIDLMI